MKATCCSFNMVVVLFSFTLLTTSLSAQPTENYILEWQDEFEGTELNTSKWAYREDNKHRSIQRRENVSIVDGVLRLDLRVLDKPIEGKTASGAGIVSTQQFRYGYYEVRTRLGNGTGSERGWHHSFWAMAAELDNDTVSNTYPGIRRTGIDGFENPTEHRFEPDLNTLNNFVQHTVVWDEQGTESGRLPTPPQNRTLIPDFDAGKWHTYAFEWTPERVRFYVDDQVTHIAEYPADEHVHDAVNVWLTAISANWNYQGDPIPSKAEYDYFRFYKAKE
jgi:beta-glucanase (GH16 family)